MKRFLAILTTVLVLISLFAVAVFAHSGRTDANGGHYNHSTGEYHYHHGRPAHQHPNGVCPYRNTSEKEKEDDPSAVILIIIVVGIIALLFFAHSKGLGDYPNNDTTTTDYDPIKDIFSKKEIKIPPPPTKSTQKTPRLPSPKTDEHNKGVKFEQKDTEMKDFNKYGNTPIVGNTSSYSPNEAELQGLKAQIAQLKKANSELRLKNSDYKNEIVDRIGENLRLSSENSDLRAEIKELKKQLDLEKRRAQIELPKLQNSESVPEYLKIANKDDYYDALASNRNSKAASGKIIIKKLSAQMYSQYSGKTYITTLDSCTCEDFKFHKKPCKHIIAFALEMKAISDNSKDI